ncbi:MAG TPA: glycosyltransferase family 2 protein [Nitrospirota bacterium]
MPFPSVHIIVLNYNRKDDTLDCLRSLYQMDYPEFKVVVVDNASTDGTPDAVRAAYPQAEVIVNPANLMFAEGNNVAIRQSLAGGADYIMLLNNDTVVANGLVTALVSAMEEEPRAGLAAPMIYYYTGSQAQPERIWYAGGIVSFARGLTAHRGIREFDDGKYSRVEETGYITGCCMMARRGCLAEVGLLDPAYFMYAEDADLSLRAGRAGWKLLFVPGGKVWHKVSASSGGEFNWFKLKNKAKSNLRLFVRYARPWHWLTGSVFIFCRAAVFALKKLTAR